MEIARMNVGKWGKIRAFFDLLTSEGFTIKGFKLVEGINGLFVGFPNQKGHDDEYRETVWAEGELKGKVSDMAKAHYLNQSGEMPEQELQDLDQQGLIKAEPPEGDEDIPF